MSIYYRGSGLTWKQYLQANFSFSSQLQNQVETLQGIRDRLDASHKTGKSFELTQARELCQIGMDRMQRGWLAEALEAFLKSEKKNSTDCLVQFLIGKLYLYGRDKNYDVIDLPKAEAHFRLAARYAKDEIRFVPEAARLCGDAYLHAAIACYAQANETWIAGNTAEARRFTEGALELSEQATQVDPKLAEAFYHHAKCAALLGDGSTATASLEAAILADRNYFRKADADRDFDGVRPEIDGLYESLRERAKAEAARLYEPLKQLLKDSVFQGTEGKKVEAEIRSAETLLGKDTYFDYLDALPLLQKAQQTLIKIPLFVKLQTLYDLDWVCNVAFSPDGRYLVSAHSSDIVRVFKVGCFQQTQVLTDGGRSIAFSPDGRYLATGDRNSTVRIWKVGGFQQIQALMGGGCSVVFSPDGRYLAAGDGNSTVRIWKVGSSFKEIQTLKAGCFVCKVAFSPNGKYLADSWGIMKVGSFQRIHEHSPWAIAFSPDGRYLACGELSSVDIWDVGSFRCLQGLSRYSDLDSEQEGFVRAIAFSPGGRYLAGGSEGGTLCIWGASRWENPISRQEFEVQERRRIEVEK